MAERDVANARRSVPYCRGVQDARAPRLCCGRPRLLSDGLKGCRSAAVRVALFRGRHGWQKVLQSPDLIRICRHDCEEYAPAVGVHLWTFDTGVHR